MGSALGITRSLKCGRPYHDHSDTTWGLAPDSGDRLCCRPDSLGAGRVQAMTLDYRYQLIDRDGMVIATGNTQESVVEALPRGGYLVDYKLMRWTRQGVYPTRPTWHKGLSTLGQALHMEVPA